MIVYCEPGAEPQYFEGVTTGTIVEPRGDSSYWDPAFQPDGYTQTYAEMADGLKNKVSHRSKALSQLGDFLARRHFQPLDKQNANP